MPDRIILDEKLFLGRGRERSGYIHPFDSTKIIKVVHSLDEKLNQNELEYDYFKYLEENDIDFSHITKCYGKTETNLGEGFIFDIVRDFDGAISLSFKYIVLNGVLPLDIEKKLILELKNYLFKNDILFIDIALSNILCKRIDEYNYKLVITDGIGGKRPGLKSKLYQYSKIFTKYKVKKQWNKFLDKYNRVINIGIKEKKRKET